MTKSRNRFKYFFVEIGNNHMFFPVPRLNKQLYVSLHVRFNTVNLEEAVQQGNLRYGLIVAIVLFPPFPSSPVRWQALFHMQMGCPPSYLRSFPLAERCTKFHFWGHLAPINPRIKLTIFTMIYWGQMGQEKL